VKIWKESRRNVPHTHKRLLQLGGGQVTKSHCINWKIKYRQTDTQSKIIKLNVTDLHISTNSIFTQNKTKQKFKKLYRPYRSNPVLSHCSAYWNCSSAANELQMIPYRMYVQYNCKYSDT
jgi:hypothetical protein